MTTTPHAYYPEQQWQGDMELGAAELLRATAKTADHSGLAHPDPLYWFEQADRWGQAYMKARLDGTDTFNLYDLAPLAHLELMEDRRFAPAEAVEGMESDQAAVLGDLHDQLAAAQRVAARDPFGIGYVYANDDTVSHLLGLALQARFYDRIAQTHTYEAFAQRQLDAVLGQNAWGLSFVVGAGSHFPRCLHHQVANLERLAGRASAAPARSGSAGAGEERTAAGPERQRRLPALPGRGGRPLRPVLRPARGLQGQCSRRAGERAQR